MLKVYFIECRALLCAGGSIQSSCTWHRDRGSTPRSAGPGALALHAGNWPSLKAVKGVGKEASFLPLDVVVHMKEKNQKECCTMVA